MLLSLSVFLLSCLSSLSAGSNVPRQISSNSSSQTGGYTCTQTMCITATVTNTNVEYVLQSRGASYMGWMAIGFAPQMSNSSMVIMWPNTDGSVTLSQRSSIGSTVQSNPPRIASLLPSSINLTNSRPSMGFTIPKNSDTIQTISWAYSSILPNSPAVDAPLTGELASGTTTLNLTGSLSQFGTANTLANDEPPLLTYQKYMVAHGIVCVIGFMLLLPLGGLVGRYLRTFTNTWFKAHWIIQFGIAGPVIIAGIALGFVCKNYAKLPREDGLHKSLGVLLFAAYTTQCTGGYIIHKWKPASAKLRRPIQNYAHGVLGVFIVGLSFFQINNGYDSAWPMVTGRHKPSNAVNIIFIVWVVLVSLLYTVGLAFLPRQYRQERENREKNNTETFPMNQSEDDPRRQESQPFI